MEGDRERLPISWRGLYLWDNERGGNGQISRLRDFSSIRE